MDDLGATIFGNIHLVNLHPFQSWDQKSKVQASAVLLCHVADVYLPPVGNLLMAKKNGKFQIEIYSGIPTTIKTMGVNITTIDEP